MKNNITKEEKLLKDIENGKYRDFYLIYNRKSTDEADNQKNSLTYQKSENARFAKKHHFNIAPISIEGFSTNGVISEKHSGFKEDKAFTIKNGSITYKIERPKFQMLVQYLNKGYIKGVISLCWDRVSRNNSDNTVIRKLMNNGVDFRFAYAQYEKNSSGELHMDIDSMFASHHSRVTSEKVILSTKSNREQGKCTYKAPIGYLNTGTMDHKPFDPERAPIIKEMYEQYATGEWSLSDIARWANKQGMTTTPMRPRRNKKEMLDENVELEDVEKVTRPITENHVSRILTSLFYTGRTKGPDGSYILSTSHEALVSDELFNKVQAVLNKKKVSIHYTEKLGHPFRGMVRCVHCERVYTPYERKGILYFNSRCTKTCENEKKNCNFDYISEKVSHLIQKLHFTEEELTEMESRIDTDISLLEQRRSKETQQLERKKKRIRDDLAYLNGNRLSLLRSGAYTPDTYTEEQQKLSTELDELKENEHISDVAMREMMQEVITLSELIKNVAVIYDFAEPHEKEQITRAIFSELYIGENMLEYKLQKGFEPFADRISAVCDLIGSLHHYVDYNSAAYAAAGGYNVQLGLPSEGDLIAWINQIGTEALRLKNELEAMGNQSEVIDGLKEELQIANQQLQSSIESNISLNATLEAVAEDKEKYKKLYEEKMREVETLLAEKESLNEKLQTTTTERDKCREELLALDKTFLQEMFVSGIDLSTFTYTSGNTGKVMEVKAELPLKVKESSDAATYEEVVQKIYFVTGGSEEEAKRLFHQLFLNN